MFLLTFALMIIAVLGTYTQVYAVQAARMFASQTTIADFMATWHNAAVTFVHNSVADYSSIGTGGCALTYSLIGGTLPACPDGILTASYLPQGYNISSYSWNSLAYKTSSGQLFVITWAPLPAGNAATNITSPPLPINMSDLYQQLQNGSVSPFFYGTVSAGSPQIVMTRQVIFANTPISYTAPVGRIPAGSVAIISNP